MDAKQVLMLRDVHTKIVAGDFGEGEVLTLFNLLREDAPPNGVLRELGNFTHRRRNKGPVHQYMRRLKEFSDNYGKRNDQLKTDTVFSEAQIADAVNAELCRYGLAPLSCERKTNIPPAQARSRQVQLVMMATLQHVAMLDGKTEFGRLVLCVAPHAFQLLGFVTVDLPQGRVWVAAPALEVGNDFCPVPPPEPHIRPKGEGVWRIYIQGGETRLEGHW